MIDMAEPPKINISSLPDDSQSSIDFTDSSFFQSLDEKRCLPTSAEVRALSPPDKCLTPVQFAHLNLIVEYGPDLKVFETQSQWMFREVLGKEVTMTGVSM